MDRYHGSPPVSVTKKVVAAADADNLKTAPGQRGNQLGAAEREGCGSCRDCDALNADELKAPLGCTFHFEAQLDRFTNALRYLVERSSLGVASRELRDGRDITPFLIALNYDIELVWQTTVLVYHST
jgi:hypothetical protein